MQYKVVSRFVTNALVICGSFVLVSCGDRDDSQDNLEFQSESADNIATDVLQRSAADNASASLDITLQSIVDTMNGSSALGSAFTIPGLGLTQEPSEDGVFNDPTEPGPLVNPTFDARVRTESASAFETSLGLSGNATTERNGNIITINPDESELCAQQGGLIGDSSCEQLLADLNVIVNAQTDTSGIIDYRFRDQSVIEIVYSPVLGSYELNLAGIQSMLVRANELDAQSDPAPDSMSGSIKFEAQVLNASAGAEAASMSMSISEAMSILDSSTGTNLLISPSTLLEITSDSRSGVASVEVGIGALSLSGSNDELIGNPLQNLMLSGITARADISNNGEVLTVSNVGLGNGPLVMSIDSLESVRATMDTFGFTIDAINDTIVLDNNLNYSVALNNILGSLDESTSHDSSSSLSISASAGTTFAEMASGVMRVNQGGPLNLIYSVFDGSTTENGSVSIKQGECFDERVNANSPIEAAPCN